MSFWATAMSAVAAPITATTSSVRGASSNSTWLRASTYTPAVTMVAAWIKAETGVGPSIASGSQMKSGICALLPVAPRNRSSVAVVMAAPPATNTCGAAEKTRSKSSDPVTVTSMNAPSMKPKSPMRLTMNAFFPASAAAGRSYQNPMSRYEQSPTPSQPTNRRR